MCAQEPRQKIIDIETAVLMLSIAMPPSEPHLDPFISFLQSQKEYTAINLDQWTSFQRFAEEVRPPTVVANHFKYSIVHAGILYAKHL